MKYMFTIFIAFLLLACIPFNVLAAGAQSVYINIKAGYIEKNDSNIYKSNVSDGVSSITTINKTTITVIGNKDAFELGVKLVVREITTEETEAFGWFTGVLKGIGNGIMPFDIYFEKGGQRIPLNLKLHITITLSDSYISPLVCYVATDGKVEVIPSSVTDGKISFETNHTGYYAIADRIKDTGGIPQTGDNTNLYPYVSLLLFSVYLLIFQARRYRKWNI